jgi:uncharacterized membrane protein YfcA
MSIAIGLLLGLLGGGGSILTVPMLVYLLHIEPKTAIVTSFVVVGISSLMALIPHARRGSVCWKSGFLFGVTGMVGAFGGGRLAEHFSSDVLMTLFGGVCLVTGILMMRNRQREVIPSLVSEPVKVCPLGVPYLRVVFDGFFVGALTGMVGVGGGFLIVPALTLLVGFPMKGAVGTSLLVIAMNAVAGLLGYSQHVSLDVDLTVIVASGSIVGSAIGALLSGYVKPALLRRVFGLMVVLVAGYILSQSITFAFIETLQQWLIYQHSVKWLGAGMFMFLIIIKIGSWIHKAKVIMHTPVDLNGER